MCDFTVKISERAMDYLLKNGVREVTIVPPATITGPGCCAGGAAARQAAVLPGAPASKEGHFTCDESKIKFYIPGGFRKETGLINVDLGGFGPFRYLYLKDKNSRK